MSEPDENGCRVAKRTHIIGYDGTRLRIRTFAWEYWHSDQPLQINDKLISRCATKGCVAKDHLMRLSIIPGTTASEDGPRWEVPADDKVEFDPLKTEKGLMKQVRQTKGDPDKLKILKGYWAARPVSEDSEDGGERVDILIDYVCGEDNDEYLRIAADWGVIVVAQ